jgi:hypothetical protein
VLSRTLFTRLDFRCRRIQECAADAAGKRKSSDERDAVVERLGEFIRLGYTTGSEVARRMGVRDSSVYSWLQGQFRPAKPERIAAFLDSMPAESGSGIAPTGYKYREYKNWRGIPKPRRSPFFKQAKGEIRKVRGGFQEVCPGCGATGPKRESHDEALKAWNGKG